MIFIQLASSDGNIISFINKNCISSVECNKETFEITVYYSNRSTTVKLDNINALNNYMVQLLESLQ